MNEQAPKKSSGCGMLAGGCGIVVVIVLILLVVAGWYVYSNWRSWAAYGITLTVTQAVEQSDMTDEQKKAVSDRVDHYAQEFVNGNITAEQINGLMESLDVKAFIAAGSAQYAGSGLIESSELSDDDKAIGKQALNRVAHGVLDGQIDPDTLGQALAPIMQTDASGNKQFKPNPTVEELQLVVDNASELADKAAVPEDVPEVDFAQRVSDAIDQALGIQ